MWRAGESLVFENEQCGTRPPRVKVRYGAPIDARYVYVARIDVRREDLSRR